MTEIGIVGSYSPNSLGDHYLLDGMINQLQSEFFDPKITVFVHNPDASQSLVAHQGISFTKFSPKITEKQEDISVEVDISGSTSIKSHIKRILDSNPDLWYTLDIRYLLQYDFWSQKYDEIKNLDLLIIGGGNVVMDLYPMGVPKFYFYSKLADIAGTPLMYYSIGAGPLTSNRGKKYYSKSIRSAECLSTRDANSLEILNSELPVSEEQTFLAADPALSLKNRDRKVVDEYIDELELDGKETVGCSLVPYFNKNYWPNPDTSIYQKYIDEMSSILSTLVSKSDKNIVFFGTNYPLDNIAIDDVLHEEKSRENMVVIDERLDSQAILGLADYCDQMICTRLHSLIPTFVSGTPFIAFSYQPKVLSFCEQIGMDEACISLNRMKDPVCEEAVRVFRMIEEWGTTIPSHKTELERLRKESRKSAKAAAEIINSK